MPSEIAMAVAARFVNEECRVSEAVDVELQEVRDCFKKYATACGNSGCTTTAGAKIGQIAMRRTRLPVNVLKSCLSGCA